MTKTNIAFFINDITSSGGTERVTCMISNMLQETCEYNIVIISLNECGGDIKFPLDSQVHTTKINKTPQLGIYRFPIVCARLARLVRRYKIDVLIDVDGILDLYSIPVRLLTRVKLISWEHFNYHQNPDVPYRRLSRQLAGIFASAIVTLTEQDASLYEDNLKIKRAKILTIPNPMSSHAASTYDSNSKIIISAGRLTYQKGFDMLVNIASEVLPQHPEWKWLVFGEGRDHEKLEQQAKEKGIASQLLFPGRTVYLSKYLEEAAFFVLTSRFEGLPMVLLEAKSHHLPLISFDCETGPREIIQNEWNGYLIQCFSIETMAQKINKLIDSPSLRILYSQRTSTGNITFYPDYITEQWNKLISSISK